MQDVATKQATLILLNCHYIMSLFTLSIPKLPSVSFFLINGVFMHFTFYFVSRPLFTPLLL